MTNWDHFIWAMTVLTVFLLSALGIALISRYVAP